MTARLPIHVPGSTEIEISDIFKQNIDKKVMDKETSSFSLPPNSELLVVKSKTLAITLALLFSNQILAQDEPPQVQASGIQQRAIIIADTQEGDSPRPIQFQSIQLSGDISNGDGAMWSFASPEGGRHRPRPNSLQARRARRRGSGLRAA